jgi:hypothetical protein
MAHPHGAPADMQPAPSTRGALGDMHCQPDYYTGYFSVQKLSSNQGARHQFEAQGAYQDCGYQDGGGSSSLRPTALLSASPPDVSAVSGQAPAAVAAAAATAANAVGRAALHVRNLPEVSGRVQVHGS